MQKSYLYNNQHKDYSRRLRRYQTDAEKALWYELRSRKLLGFKFRRQFPIDNYILDFYCKELNLAIELDGSHHMKTKQITYDEKRTADLKKLGLIVVRFYDNDIFNNLPGVLEVISTYAKTSP